jgi:hypothetical protein
MIHCLHLILFIFFLAGNVMAQNIVPTKIEELPEFTFAEIAWTDSAYTCIIADRAQTNKEYIHRCMLYNKDGKMVSDKKIITTYSIQHEYSFTLNKTHYFLYINRTNPGRMILKGKAVVNQGEEFTAKEISILNISREYELKKLHSEKYKFNVFKGTSGNRALVTYNNDYADPYKEGFQFLLMDEHMQMTPTETFELPYSDRLCNITSITYDDDANRIAMLCDIFTMNGEDRIFQKNIAAVYEINSNSYREFEIKDQQFYRHKINSCFNGSHFSVGGILLPQDQKRRPIPYAFTEINLQNGHTKNTNGMLSDDDAKSFYKLYNYKADDFLRPIHAEKDSSGMQHMIWSYHPVMDEITGENTAEIFLGISAALLLGVYLNVPLNAESPDGSSAMIWLKIPESGKAETHVMMDTLATDNYARHNFSPIAFNGEMHVIFNRPTESRSIYSQPCFYFSDGSQLKNKKELTASMKTHKVNTIYPLSAYRKNNEVYYLGHYSFSTDPYGDDRITKARYYILKVMNN